jgi:hypothetical protein
MNLSQFFKDDTGQLSSMRLVFLVWGLGLFVVWAIISIITKQMFPVPESCIEILGICTIGKAANSITEGISFGGNNQPPQQPEQQDHSHDHDRDQVFTAPPGFPGGPPAGFQQGPR